MNEPKYEFRFPVWVNSRHLILGDICYRHKIGNGQRIKMLYTGRHWIEYKIAPKSLKRKSERRADAMKHFEAVRKTGL